MSSRDLIRQISNGVALIRCAFSALETWSTIFLFMEYIHVNPLSHASYDSGPKVPDLNLGKLVFPSGNENNRHCWVAQLAGNAHWAEPSPLFAHMACPSPLSCKEYLVLAPGTPGETTVQAVVGSIDWAFYRHKKARNREMSASAYALHSVRTQLSFSFRY